MAGGPTVHYPTFIVDTYGITLTAEKVGTLTTSSGNPVEILSNDNIYGYLNITTNNGTTLLNDALSFDSFGNLASHSYSSGSAVYSGSNVTSTSIRVKLTLCDETYNYIQVNNISLTESCEREVKTTVAGTLKSVGKYNNAKIKGLYYNSSPFHIFPETIDWDNVTLSNSVTIDQGSSIDIYVIMDRSTLNGNIELSKHWNIIKADTLEETNANRDLPFNMSKWENGCCVSVPEIRETGDFLTYNNSQITYTRNGSANSLTANMFIEDTETTPSVIYVPGEHVKRILYQSTDGYVYAVPDYGYSIASSPSSAGVAGAQKTNSPTTSATQTIGSTTIKRVEAISSGVLPPEVVSISIGDSTTADGRRCKKATLVLKNPNSTGYYLRYKTIGESETAYKSSYVSAGATTTAVTVSGNGVPGGNPPSVVGSVLAFFVNNDGFSYYKHSSIVKININGGKNFGSISDRDIFIEETDIKKIVAYPS